MQLNSLSAISEELALVETREHLSHIFCKLKMMLGFSHSTLFVVTGDASYISDFLADHQPGSPFFREIKLGKTPLDLDDQIFDDMIPYLRPGTECNFRKGILLNLNKGSEIIGSWVILYEHTNNSDGQDEASLRLLTNAINMAVVSVLANEQISAIKQESDIIQSINTDLSATREKTDLLKIIDRKSVV